MASASLFREMKSINPATISRRPAAAFSMLLSMDKSKKVQDTSSLYGPGFTASTEGKISAYRVYYGGKGGKGRGVITSEIIAEVSTGEFSNNDQFPRTSSGGNGVDSKMKSKFDTTFFQTSFSLFKFLGIGFAKYSMEGQDSGTVTLDSETNGVSTIIQTGTTKIDMQQIRLGLRGNIGLDYGLYFDLLNSQDLDQKSSLQTETPSAGKVTSKRNKAGIGLGYSSKKFHLEGFYEKQLKDVTTQGLNSKTYSPVRYGVTIEMKLGSLSLGYTGLIYSQGFVEIDKELNMQVLFPGSLYEDRVENIFNFSFGGKKGHSFGGSAFYSQVNAQLKYENSGTENLFPTTITAMGASLKYSYAFK